MNMERIKLLINELSLAARADTAVGIEMSEGGRSLRILRTLDAHSSPESLAAYQAAYDALLTAIRQDQDEGVKLATPADVSGAITGLRTAAYTFGRRHTGGGGFTTSSRDVDDAENRLRRLVEPQEPREPREPVDDPSFIKLVEAAASAHTAWKRELMVLSSGDPTVVAALKAWHTARDAVLAARVARLVPSTPLLPIPLSDPLALKPGQNVDHAVLLWTLCERFYRLTGALWAMKPDDLGRVTVETAYAETRDQILGVMAQPVEDPTTDVEFGLLLQEVVKAAKERGRLEAFTAADLVRSKAEDRITTAVARVIRGRGRVQSEYADPNPSFDQLLNTYVANLREFWTAHQIQLLQKVADRKPVEEAEKRALAARDAVRGRYMGLDRQPPSDAEKQEFLATVNTLVVNVRVASGSERQWSAFPTPTERDQMIKAQALEDEARKKLTELFNR